MKKTILTSLILLFLSVSPILAADCFDSFIGNQTSSTICTLKTYEDGNNGARSVSGVDSGTASTNTARLTVSAGTMTITSTQTLVVGDIVLTGEGSIATFDGGSVLEIGKPMWMIDADADGYPSDTKMYVQTTAPTNGQRLNTMTSITTTDCDDNDGGVGGGTLSTYYQDSDGDLYGNPSVSTEACSAPIGYVTDNTDCYDSNANAKPGQTTCYSSHRGDGSFDYNCDSSSTGCNTCPASCVSGSSFWTKGCCGVDPNKYCCNASYKSQKSNSGSAACGASGAYAGSAKKSVCTQYPCQLSIAKNISCYACTKTCK